MNLKKASGRLAARRRSFDAADYPDGFKRPGSYKKPWPRGRQKSHKTQGA